MECNLRVLNLKQFLPKHTDGCHSVFYYLCTSLSISNWRSKYRYSRWKYHVAWNSATAGWALGRPPCIRLCNIETKSNFFSFRFDKRQDVVCNWSWNNEGTVIGIQRVQSNFGGSFLKLSGLLGAMPGWRGAYRAGLLVEYLWSFLLDYSRKCGRGHLRICNRSMDNGFLEDYIPFYAIECIFRIYLEKNHVVTLWSSTVRRAACTIASAPPRVPTRVLICEVCLYIFTRAMF